jgi:hypothetical protein
MLTLDENLMLLALDDHTGQVVPMPAFALELGLAAALVLELWLLGYVRLESEQVHTVICTAPPKDPLLQEAWQTLLQTCAPAQAVPLEAALQALLPIESSIAEKVCAKLVGRQILRHDAQTQWFWVTTHTYPMEQGTAERVTRQGLHKLVLGASEASWQPRLAMLLGLVVACRLEHEVFSPQEWESAQVRVQAILQDTPLGLALHAAIGRVQMIIAQVITFSGR